jgi:hypothetical protein
MKVSCIYINTYRYDFQFAKVCIASIRYWYPRIPIILIKDFGAGNFYTSFAEQNWNVQIFETDRKKFGWGFGKLEPLFQQAPKSFLVLDADTVLTGPILNVVENCITGFVVDEEVQPMERLGEIYYDLDKISKLEPSFVYPGYSFNTGQWFGTSGLLARTDFEKLLRWSEPPIPVYPHILFNGEQGILNFMLQLKEQQGTLSVSRKKFMIWPVGGLADFIDLNEIRSKNPVYPFVIHWAGVKSNRLKDLPRGEIISFYQDYYYSSIKAFPAMLDRASSLYINYENKVRKVAKKIKNKLTK